MAWQNRVVQEHGFELASIEIAFAVILMRQMPGDEAAAQKDSGVKPGLVQNRRHVGFGVDVFPDRERVTPAQGGEIFGVELIDSSKAAELALYSIEKAMMVGVRRHEAIAAHVVVCLHSLHHVDRKGQARDPRVSGSLIGKIELS